MIRRLSALVGERGALRSGDPERMALQFISLTTFESTTAVREGRTPTPDEITTMVAEGVRTFLYGYHASS